MGAESLSKVDLRKAYEGGSPLRRSWFDFAPESSWRKIELLKVLPVGQDHLASQGEFDAAEDALKNWVLLQLSTERLQALGYRKMVDDPPETEGVTARLEAISPYLADPRYVQWREGRIVDPYVDYFEVRIVASFEIVTATGTTALKRRVGRKGMKPYAAGILQELFEKEPELINASSEALIEKFNALLLERHKYSHPPAHSVDVRSLRNYLNDYWK